MSSLLKRMLIYSHCLECATENGSIFRSVQTSDSIDRPIHCSAMQILRWPACKSGGLSNPKRHSISDHVGRTKHSRCPLRNNRRFALRISRQLRGLFRRCVKTETGCEIGDRVLWESSIEPHASDCCLFCLNHSLAFTLLEIICVLGNFLN